MKKKEEEKKGISGSVNFMVWDRITHSKSSPLSFPRRYGKIHTVFTSSENQGGKTQRLEIGMKSFPMVLWLMYSRPLTKYSTVGFR